MRLSFFKAVALAATLALSGQAVNLEKSESVPGGGAVVQTKHATVL